MRLERLSLENFRSIRKATYHLGRLVLIVAPNGSGKTNILEAIRLLSTGVSERAGKIEEMIAWGEELSRVSGIVEEGGEREELAVVLTRGMYLGKRTPKRRTLVDGVGRERSVFSARLLTSLFRPEDMRLLEGSPSRRRQYLDEAIGSAHPEYLRAQATYEAALKRRNKILDLIREGSARRVELAYWDQSLVKNGNILTDYRRTYLSYLNEWVRVGFGTYRIEEQFSTISPERLAQYSEAEVAVGYTLVGPHKDDFTVQGAKENGEQGKKREVDLMIYGSRGEQRLGVLFLKTGAMQYAEEKRGVKSLLLLDDIFSELDQLHRQEVVQLMAGRQVIMTSAEEETVQYLAKGAEVIRLSGES